MMSALALLLALLLLFCGPSVSLEAGSVYVRARNQRERHIGCAEKKLRAVEHLLLPRILRCSNTHCWNDGGIALPVHKLECDNDGVCSVQVFCQSRLGDVLSGMVLTFAGFIGILVFVCAPMPPRAKNIKLHKT